MAEYLSKVRKKTDETVAKIRRWEKEQAAKEVMRDYLSEQGLELKTGSKLDELLNERHRLALTALDENVKLKAIDSSLSMAAGNEKVTNVQNNQFNFGDFVNGLKD